MTEVWFRHERIIPRIVIDDFARLKAKLVPEEKT